MLPIRTDPNQTPSVRTQTREGHMTDKGFGRRDFLKGAVVGGAAAAATAGNLPDPAQAQQGSPPAAAGYQFLHNEEAAFVEALVDHMIPADEHTPKGTDVGLNVFIDRALAGAWGKGDRRYMQGPWKIGRTRQGYPLPPPTTILSSEFFCEAAGQNVYHPFPRPTANASRAYTNPDGSKYGACQYCGYCGRFG